MRGIAPMLAPVKAGYRVETDRRDAERLARSHRAGDLTAMWVPDECSEALRDLVRAREAAKQEAIETVCHRAHGAGQLELCELENNTSGWRRI